MWASIIALVATLLQVLLKRYAFSVRPHVVVYPGLLLEALALSSRFARYRVPASCLLALLLLVYSPDWLALTAQWLATLAVPVVLLLETWFVVQAARAESLAERCRAPDATGWRALILGLSGAAVLLGVVLMLSADATWLLVELALVAVMLAHNVIHERGFVFSAAVSALFAGWTLFLHARGSSSIVWQTVSQLSSRLTIAIVSRSHAAGSTALVLSFLLDGGPLVRGRLLQAWVVPLTAMTVV